MFSFEESFEIDDEWQEFIMNGKLSNENYLTNNNSEIKEIPKCTDIYISTKTKIVYLNKSIDLDNVFWKINIMDYHEPKEGIVKKQMKFNFINKDEVNKFEVACKDFENLDVQIISKIDNPEGRIKFKDIRKVSIGICQKDIISFRTITQTRYKYFLKYLHFCIKETLSPISNFQLCFYLNFYTDAESSSIFQMLPNYL